MSVSEPDTMVIAPRGAHEVLARSTTPAGRTPAADEPVRDEPAVRQWVGRYELIHRIAHGGMATVYLGRSKGKAGFEKIVAVKLIHPHLASEEEFVGMFLDEARIAARLHHPHVVEILDLGDSDGVYYMVMEFIEGENLAALVRALGQSRGEPADQATPRLPVAVILQIVADTLEGLNAAHELRDADGRPYELVHRDVSPHNILINLDGWAKVGDFGIMKAAGKTSNTKTGELRGKLAYMSPEQARGGAVDHRTDLFALGVIMWELLTGERLFACASEAATLEKVVACVVPRLDEVDPKLCADLPELRAGLQGLLDRALAADPAQRPSDASTMLAEIKRLARLDRDATDAEEPRDYLGRTMRRFFQARVNYARAALRRTGEHDALTSRPPTGSNGVISLTPTSSNAASNPGSASHPQLPPNPLAQWSMWLLLPMLGAGIAIAAMLLFGPSLQGPDAELEQTTSGEAEPAPLDTSPSPRTLAATEYQPVTQTVTRKQAPPGQVRWYFSTTPPGAQIMVDGEVRGEPTPTWIYLPTSEELLDIRLELDGYEARTLQLPAVHDQTFSEVLEPSPASKAVRKSNKPRKPSGDGDKPNASSSVFVPAPESLRNAKPK